MEEEEMFHKRKKNSAKAVDESYFPIL